MQTNRRRFLIASGLSAAAASRAWGANDYIRVGAIGCGGRMRDLLHAADTVGGYQLVAACDVYEPRRDEIRERTNSFASTHLDYREVLDRNDIDAVLIASPDHWHVRMALDALAAGKDVYLEKPVTHKLEEGDVLIRAVRSSTRILQCGMQQRSWVHFQSAVDLIQGGNIGRITRVRTYWYQNYQNRSPRVPIDLNLLDWLCARSALRRRKIPILALVLGLRRRCHDRPVHPLDRCRPLGDEGRRASGNTSYGRSICLQVLAMSGHGPIGFAISRL